MSKTDPCYLRPTAMIDSDGAAIRSFAREVTTGVDDPSEKAVHLFYAVRDGVQYDPYTPFYRPEHYRASRILRRGRGFCIPKAVLLCALGRACGIASRLGFATVRNHLTTRRLAQYMGTDLFVYHGYTEFFLHNRWVKATPTFNIELCRRHRVDPLDFDGVHDALLQSFNREKRRFMEYLENHGSFHDVPVDTIVAAWKAAYGPARVERWIEALEGQSPGAFSLTRSR
ncbi:MAG: transglutaminase-like domain-containing protein [Desulfobacterales bacterium]